MINNNKPISLLNSFFSFLILLLILTYSPTLFSQEDIKEDFSKAEDAEKKKS